jgi:SOS-response transcriptional repressor LexA
MTEKQAEIYRVIDEWWKKYGFAPSIENIMFITGDRSKGNVHRLIGKLCDLGHCKKLPKRARSVRPSYIKVKNIGLD